MSVGQYPNQDYSRVIFTVMKDEGPFILEWISYHLSIGFTHFVVLTNDCSDGTDKILRQLEKLGVVTHKNNPAPHPKGPQKSGYGRMRNLEAFDQAGWMMTLDCDEFLRIDVGRGHLDDLFENIGETVDAVSFLWQLFGNDDIAHLEDDLIINQFTKASHPLQARPYEVRSFKTLYKGEFFGKLGTHRPNDFDMSKLDNFLWIDANGMPISQFTKFRHWNAQENGLAFGTCLGRVNHYALRSLDSFIVKWMRGFVHPTAPTVRGKGTPSDYWKLFNWTQHEELGIVKWAEETQALRAQLTEEFNLKNLTKKATNWHQDRAEEIRKANPELFQELKNLSPSKVDDDLPDFSKHGCPPIGTQNYINLDQLRTRLSHSVLSPELLKTLDKLTIPS